MAKIRVEFEVPSGEYCKDCIYWKRDGNGYGYCYIFNKELKVERTDWSWGKVNIHRCDECKQAEVAENDAEI